MDRIYDICFGCDHFCSNNDDKLLAGCRAFPYPDGIPDDIGDVYSHDIVLEGQTTDFVYTPAKNKKNRFGRRIKIYQ